MATTIVTKNSVTAASAPTISDIIQGELASNLTDGFLFSRDEANNIVSFGVIKQGASSTYTPRFDGTNWLPSSALTNDGTDIGMSGALTVVGNVDAATFTGDGSGLTGLGGTGDANLTDITYERLNTNGDVGTSAGQLAIGNHTHTGVYEEVGVALQLDSTLRTTVFTAGAGKRYFCDASTPFTATLPASPSEGDIVGFVDYGQTWGTTNLTIGRNGSDIMDAATDLICDVLYGEVTLQYHSVTKGWIVV